MPIGRGPRASGWSAPTKSHAA